jgi:hypothetical protein
MGHNTYILSPDQVKFNQENLRQRFEEEDNDMMLNLNNGSNLGIKSHTEANSAIMSLHNEHPSSNVTGGGSSIVTLSNPHRKNSHSRTN